MNMKKIGIITINDFSNYGNRLQCYAVQEYLREKGFIVENIYNKYSADNKFILVLKSVYWCFQSISSLKIIKKRMDNFSKFNQLIQFSSEKIINGKYSKNLNTLYDYFVTGSDQVWNPMDSGRSETDFLAFASDGKKVSFSASMGVDTIPAEKESEYKRLLSDFKSISVREESAKRIIERITGRNDVEVLVDPTMLLNIEIWNSVMEKPNLNEYFDLNYILVYFLGESKEYRKLIDHYANEMNCQVINIYDKRSTWYSCGPQHFLYLIKHAQLICTDSYHSAIFSFLFNRPFVMFGREHRKMNMNTRMTSFLEKFHLSDRRYSQEKSLNEYLEWDYSTGYGVLKNEKKKAEIFFRNVYDDIGEYV